MDLVAMSGDMGRHLQAHVANADKSGLHASLFSL
jgi:hypothetical protein